MPIGASSLRVLLVEDRGDRPSGHYAPMVRRLADAFVAAGHPTTVLTSLGLSREAAGAATGEWEVRRFGPAARRLEQFVRRVDGLPHRHRWRRPLRQVTGRLRSLLILTESLRAARRLGGSDQVVVIVCGTGLSPMLAAWFVPTRSRWISYRHDSARRSTPRPSAAGMVVERLAGSVTDARVRSRTRHGGGYALAGTLPELVESWRPRLPQVPMGTVGLAVADSTGDVVDRVEARQRLGLSTTGPLALFFGAIHPGKAPATVWAAWASGRPPVAGLVAAGAGVAASLAGWSERHGQEVDRSQVHVFDGAIDDDTKQLLFRAVDLGVLSFRAEPLGASATMGEFMTHGRGVCCSSGGEPAALVARYGVGAVFEAEVPEALVDAVNQVVERPPPPTAFDDLRADFAESRLAAQMLELVTPAPV